MLPLIAIVGRPNVGKSTLFNRLVGSRRAITLDESGVTRDRHYGHGAWEGRDYMVVDTGGLVLSEAGSIEKKVREQVEVALREATVILMVVDGRTGLLPEERGIARQLARSQKPVFYVVNKADEVDSEQYLNDFYELGEDLYPISAEHGLRVNDLMDKVIAEFPPAEERSKEKRIRVSLIGRPNVGKSSLLNRLLGEERVIVHSEPGTTRDTIDTYLEIGRKKYQILDTAGIRRGGKSDTKVERYSVLNSLKAIERSDVCLLLLDAAEGISKQDAHVAGYAQEAKKGLILVWNKWDLVLDSDSRSNQKKFEQKIEDDLRFLNYAPILFLSAQTGWGCRDVWTAVDEMYEACGKRVTTSQVNKSFEKLVHAHNPPVYKGKPVKFFYATQTRNFPPTIVIFVNEPEGVHFSFHRYLVNGLRRDLEFNGAPIELLFRRKRH